MSDGALVLTLLPKHYKRQRKGSCVAPSFRYQEDTERIECSQERPFQGTGLLTHLMADANHMLVINMPKCLQTKLTFLVYTQWILKRKRVMH